MPLTGKAFLPEVPAYVDALSDAGHTPIVIEPGADFEPKRDDVVIRFGGLLRADRRRSHTEIHEYHNLSRTRLPRLRDGLKGLASVGSPPDGRIFVTEFVRDSLRFPDKAQYMVRDQGASTELLRSRSLKQTDKYDVVYAGTIADRHGLMEAFQQLHKAGLRIGVAGLASQSDRETFRSLPNIEFLGKIPAEQIPSFYRSGRFGLFYCPDQAPFNQETGTKALEYLVAGLPIIANKYRWIEAHARQHSYSYIDLANIQSPAQLVTSSDALISDTHAATLTWPAELERSGFVSFVESIHQQRLARSPQTGKTLT